MFVETLRVHWKALRWPLAILSILAFAGPALWAIPEAAFLGGLPVDQAVRYWMAGRQPNDADLLFPVLAVSTGALIALGVWYWDHRADHVLALSLPVPRTRYVLFKLGAGACLLAVVSIAFFLGSIAASAGLDFPDWLHAHPVRLTFKFLLASLVVYALLFALAAGTIPTALTALTAFAVVAVLVPLLPLVFGASIGDLALRTSELVARALYEWPGVFSIIGGNWALVGV